jgi:hypothetical protein
MQPIISYFVCVLSVLFLRFVIFRPENGTFSLAKLQIIYSVAQLCDHDQVFLYLKLCCYLLKFPQRRQNSKTKTIYS